MFRLALLGSAHALVSDETSLMQGLKPQQVSQKEDKSKAISNLLQSATQMLKNGATSDVVEFAQATLTEITSIVLPAITDAHTADQALIDSTHAMFETILLELEAGNNLVKTHHDNERAFSASHKACRAEEETVCGVKRECDYELWAKWKSFTDEESLMRDEEGKISTLFCAQDANGNYIANGTTWGFRNHAVDLFPPFIDQWPEVVRTEGLYVAKRPDCEVKYTSLEEKTAECDALQLELDGAACTHSNTVREVRNSFAGSWANAVITYQRVMDEVHCLEIDRWKEWRSLASVQCLLDKTTERNGRPCDEETSEITTEVGRCEAIQADENIDHLRIVYHETPLYPDPCPTPPWEPSPPAYFPRCVPVDPQAPCSEGYIAQEYADLWDPPREPFHSPSSHSPLSLDGHSHCNLRPPCTSCEQVQETHTCHSIMMHVGAFNFYPQPEHQCDPATRAQQLIGEFDSWGLGHWNRAYVRMAYGSGDCEEGKKITTAEECREAHDFLGFQITPEWNGDFGSIPGYCTTREPSSHGGEHFHFNARASGVPRPDLAPICRA